MNNKLPLLAAEFFNQPLLMRPQDYEYIAYALQDRFGINLGDGKNLKSPDYEEKSEKRLSVYDGIHHIPIIGALTHRAGRVGADCLPLESYSNIRQVFHNSNHDKAVKTRLMELDSGGGQAAGCFDLAHYMLSLRGTKKTIAFVNESAYSACYALAATCDEIYLTPSAGVGSIGVICGRLDRTKTNQSMGLRIEMFTSGSAKADGQPDSPLQQGERERTQKVINMLADQFFDVVSAGRNLSKSKIQSLEAGCLFGDDAVRYGLADGVMSQDEIGDYLQSISKERLSVINLFNQSKTADKDEEISTLKTKLEESENKIAALKKEFSNEAASAVRQGIEQYVKEQSAFVKAVNSMCKTAEAEQFSGMLIQECESIEAARDKLSTLLAQTDGPDSSFDFGAADTNERNYLMDAVDAELKELGVQR